MTTNFYCFPNSESSLQENFQIVISGPATLPVPMMPLHKEFEKWRRIVVPKMDSGKSRLHNRDYVLALEDVSQAEEKQIIYESKRATPKNKRLFEAYELQQEGMMKQKSLYLLRDTLKVLGSPENNLSPITAGIFFVNEDDPEAGGTGHTMRVCRQNSIHVFTQDVWLSWM